VGKIPFVGLTGGLGAGKSTALQALERLGAATLSTDSVVHELYAGDEVRDLVVARWGDEVAPGGVVDRSLVAAVVETPLMFEAGMDAIYDATIAIVAEEEVRAARAAARGHAALQERSARQLSQDEKARRATFAIRNDASVEQLERALSDVLGRLLAS